jgi:hypothetical protein
MISEQQKSKGFNRREQATEKIKAEIGHGEIRDYAKATIAIDCARTGIRNMRMLIWYALNLRDGADHQTA